MFVPRRLTEYTILPIYQQSLHATRSLLLCILSLVEYPQGCEYLSSWLAIYLVAIITDAVISRE